jgi:DUF1680 family protein
MPGFIYAQDGKDNEKDAIYVNLYVSSETSFKVDAKDIALTVDSEMPWGGKSRITVSTRDAANGTIKLRIPGWARNQPVPGSLLRMRTRIDKRATVSVNGKRQCCSG